MAVPLEFRRRENRLLRGRVRSPFHAGSFVSRGWLFRRRDFLARLIARPLGPAGTVASAGGAWRTGLAWPATCALSESLSGLFQFGFVQGAVLVLVETIEQALQVFRQLV